LELRMPMFQVQPNPAPGDLDREMALFMAKKAEEAERYEEMILYMKRIVECAASGDEMKSPAPGETGSKGVEERNLISVGYKNIMSQRRTAHRTVMNCISPDEAKNQEFKQKIAEEVFALIKEVIDEIVTPFVDGPKKATDPEVLVFFKKMEGDYNRYGAEITEGAQRDTYKAAALAAYDTAQTMADGLDSTNPIRLGLALNFSVFYYEICDKKEDACNLAKRAFDTAIDHLDALSEEAYKDSTLIMQLLKDNLTLWTECDDQDGDDIQVEDIEA